MKKYLFFYFVVALLISCSNETSLKQEKNSEETSLENELCGYGQITFNFEKNTDNFSRTVISTSIAEELSDSYELYIYNSSNKYKETISNNSKLTLAVGTYNAVLLAKNNEKDYGNAYGSSFVKDITIEQNRITTVEFIILPFDISFTAPSTIEPEDIFEIKLIVDTRNPLLTLRQSGTSTFYGLEGIDFATLKSASAFQSNNIITYTYKYQATSNIPNKDVEYIITDSSTYYAAIRISDNTYDFVTGTQGEKEISTHEVRYGGYSDKFSIENISYCKILLKKPTTITGIKPVIKWEE